MIDKQPQRPELLRYLQQMEGKLSWLGYSTQAKKNGKAGVHYGHKYDTILADKKTILWINITEQSTHREGYIRFTASPKHPQDIYVYAVYLSYPSEQPEGGHEISCGRHIITPQQMLEIYSLMK